MQTGPIRVRLIQAQHRGAADGRHVRARGSGGAIDRPPLDRSPDDHRSRRFLRARDPRRGDLCRVGWRRVRYGRSRWPPSFEQGATHSAKTEIVRIVLTALRADQDSSPDIFLYSLTLASKVV